MYILGFCQYMTETSNVFDMFGILSTILFFSVSRNFSYEISTILLTVGVVGSYYKGIMAMSSMSSKFRVLIKLLEETFQDMIPYTIILASQIIIFTILSKTNILTANSHGVLKDSKLIPSFTEELGRWYMVLFGSYPNLDDLDWYQWVLIVNFTFMLNVLNLNLLISIIGATFDRVTHNQTAMNYRMKAQSLIEIATMHKWQRQFNNHKYFHWFLYKDRDMSTGSDAWEERINKIIRKIKKFNDEVK